MLQQFQEALHTHQQATAKVHQDNLNPLPTPTGTQDTDYNQIQAIRNTELTYLQKSTLHFDTDIVNL